MTDRVTLSNPRFSPVPAARVADPSLQRVHDALKEVVETIRGTRGDPLDRAVFLRDLVDTGILKRFGSGQIGVGPAIPGDSDPVIDPTIPPALTNIIATAGFSYVLLTWNDPQFRSLAYYEVWRRQVADPTSNPGYTADDARITLSEQSERTALLGTSNRTPQQTRLMQALGALQSATDDYDYAKATHLLYPDNAELEQAYTTAGNDLKAARLEVEVARADDDSSATLIARVAAPVLSDPVDRGTTYIYWVRAVSTAGTAGPFNANGVSVTTQPDISGVIDELTDEANRGPVADFIFNGLDVPGSPGESLLELLDTLQEQAGQAEQNASDALAAVLAGIPPSILQAIHDLYNALASTVLGTVIKRYEVSRDVATLQDRVATAETTVLNQADDIAALSGEITTFSTQYESQFAQVNSAIVALSDADSAFAIDITGLEGAVYDSQLGVLAAHSRVDDVLSLNVTADSALGQKFTTLEAEVDDASGKVADILSLQLSPTSALGARLTQINLALDDLNGSVSDLLALSISDESALAQRLTAFNLGLGNVAGSVRDILNLAIDPTSALAQSLRSLEASVGAAQGGVQDLLTLSISENSLLAIKLSQLTGSVGSAAGQIKDILDLSISPTSALATKLSSLEATVGTSAGQIQDILALDITGDSALVGKLTELDAETTYATGAIESMLTLDLTSTEVANTAFAGAMQKIDLVLGDVGSTLETAVYNQITDLKAAGEFDDPVARAGWGVRIQQTAGGQDYVSGFGIAQQLYEDPDGTYNAYSEFVVAADKFVILDPSNPDKTKNSPFIVAADPDTGEMKVWIRAAMIQKAAIQELIAGSVVADAIRANAFVQTGYLATPIINVGTWTQTVPGDPFSWTYDAGTGRQGNFSVDSNGVMHARYAVLESLTVKTADGRILMGSGDGSYTSVGINNNDLYLQNTSGTYSLVGGGAGVDITITGLGYVGALDATRNAIYRQTTPPTGGTYTTGDLWIDTDSVPTTVSQWTGSAWSIIGNYTTNTSQLADGANLGGTAQWSGVTGTGKPEDGATKNVIYRQASAPTGGTYTTGDLWHDTDANPVVLYSWTGSAWTPVANNVTNTNQVIDGANLGGTATWGGVTGAGKPADNATRNMIFRQTTAPTGGTYTTGDLWIDTDAVPTTVSQWSGSAWTVIGNYTTNTTQLTDGANLGGTATWSGVSGSGKPEDGATKNVIYRQTTAPTGGTYTLGDLWYDTDSNPVTLYSWSGSAWVAVANNVTNTNQVIDGANLGGTATWGGITGSGKPADNATRNVIYRQTSPPSGGTYTTGDLWIDTDSVPTTVSQWSGSAWTVVGNYTTNTSQLADGANLGGTATWSGVSGSGKPADNATRNVIYRQTAMPTGGTYTTGDLWYDTDANPITLHSWTGSEWTVVANNVTNTNQVTDGANLGGTATWAGVTGAGKPADNATRNVIYRQTAMPTGGTYTTGDLWIDTDAVPTTVSQWTGSAWSVVGNYTTNTSQLTDGANLGGTATWSGVSGSGKPEDGATKNVIYRQTTAPTGGTYTTGDLWYDTDANPITLYSWNGSAWAVVANNVTNTNQVVDGANLGGTAIWSGVTGTGRPEDNATVGANWNSNLINIPYEEIVKNDDATALGFNPAFAAWADGASPPDGWSLYGSGGTLTRNTSVPRLGSYCVQFDVSGGDYGVQRTVTFPALPGGTFISGSVDIRYTNRTSGIPSLLVSVSYDDGSSQFCTGTNGYASHVAPPTGQANTWHRLPWAVYPSNRTKRMTGITIYLLGSNAFLSVPYVGRVQFDSLQFAFFGDENAVVGINNPITSSNIGTYIANLAVSTLHIGANTVTVPAAATWAGTLTTLGTTTWTDLVSVNVTVPSTGVPSIDTAVPVLITWATEAGIQNSNNQIRRWRVVRVLSGATTVLYTTSSTALDLEHFASGVVKTEVDSGSTYTFKLQGQGVPGVPVWQASIWATAVRR